jgi:hypothetical protein
MRMLLDVALPHEPFNSMVRKGTAGASLQKILESIKPEAAYFTDQDGRRGGVLVVDLKDPSQLPALVEPWFLTFNADCKLRVAMTPQDLAQSGLDKIAKNW